MKRLTSYRRRRATRAVPGRGRASHIERLVAGRSRDSFRLYFRIVTEKGIRNLPTGVSVSLLRTTFD